jgi:Na+-transporting NADH:ubiquinone oxidoreductase subunit A
MKAVKIRKGLNIPISGRPTQVISGMKQSRTIAVLGDDYVGLKPRMEAVVGDRVALGQVLFSDKRFPSVRFVSPGSGKVIAINRGARRKLESIVIELDGNEEVTFGSYTGDDQVSLNRTAVAALLLESGLWTSIRARPFGTVADPQTVPHSIFVTAMDTNPLAPSIDKILEGNREHFLNGLTIISMLTDGNVFVCKDRDSIIPEPDNRQVTTVAFSGPHPAGNVGTHIHFLDPVSRNKQVWHVGVQDVIAVGILFTNGRLNVERIISFAGPSVKNPRLIRTRIGTSIEDLIEGELHQGDHRMISGPVLSGRTATGSTAFLGRYHQQLSIVPEVKRKKALEWLLPGFGLYSTRFVVSSWLCRKKEFDLDTSTHGRTHAIYPIGNYEKIMPLDIIPTYLLRALAIDDIEDAEGLGCMELDEEDLALCSFVCPSKIDHGKNLRRVLQMIGKEG